VGIIAIVNLTVLYILLLYAQCASPVDESHVLSNGRAREDSADFKKRLRKELVNRDGQR